MPRLPKIPADTQEGALTHLSQRGVTWYLHQGTTSTGKPKYFVAKKVGAGALAVMPDGLEFTESVNGVVGVGRVGRDGPLKSDLEVLRAEMARHPHLEWHKGGVDKGALCVFEPQGGATLEGWPAGLYLSAVMSQRRVEPVMRFEGTDEAGVYVMKRMTYRGNGGWSYPLDTGPLAKLLKKYLPAVGTDAFFDLM